LVLTGLCTGGRALARVATSTSYVRVRSFARAARNVTPPVDMRPFVFKKIGWTSVRALAHCTYQDGSDHLAVTKSAPDAEMVKLLYVLTGKVISLVGLALLDSLHIRILFTRDGTVGSASRDATTSARALPETALVLRLPTYYCSECYLPPSHNITFTTILRITKTIRGVKFLFLFNFK
jgi:hypothetical protein